MRWWSVGFGLACALILVCPGALAGNEIQTLSVSVPVGSLQLAERADGQKALLDGYGRLMVPGKPDLPGRIYAVALPPGAEPVAVRYTAGEPVELPGRYAIRPVPLPRPLGQADPALEAVRQREYEANYRATYGQDEPYPSRLAWFVRRAGYRKYNLVDVQVAPVVYNPQSGRLVYYPDLTVHIDYVMPERAPTPIQDNLVRTERIAREFILNYDQAQAWYPSGRVMDRGLHDFVFIVDDSLTMTVSPLVEWETSKGRNVQVVTVGWINANYSGYDLAERIRNFLREKYPSEQWGIEDVLLVGHYDDVPMRRCAQDLGYGQPETDFYYAELSLPDADSWDADGDHQWGEDTDPIDFYSEVNVGRIPWTASGTVGAICQKSIAYEQNDDPSFKKNILLLGAFFWDDDPNPRTDNAVLMEAKVDQPWMADWTMTRMYEQGYSTYPMDYDLRHNNVVAVWSTGTYAFVNWAGHGSPTSSHIYHSTGEAFITADDCPQLSDEYPAIIFADACSNSDTDEFNIGQAMLQHGAVGFVGATKVALGMPGWSGPADGSSQSLDYFFTTCVTSGEYTQGAALQWALRQMYTQGLWAYNKYETFEWGALWGNPNLGMGSPPALSFSFPDGLPEYVLPGTPTVINLLINDGLETYVPGSGLLYYRYDGGDFLTAPLTHVAGNQYQATLPPAGCDDEPEFYFSATGDGGTTVFSPATAPDNVYAATVGVLTVIVEDDFETDTGWTVGDVGDDATTGIWDRADPEGTEAQPEDDHTLDPGTQCWVTDHRAGDSLGSWDVDGGKTTLMSPVYDFSAFEDVTISYYRWYSNDTGATPHTDVFVVDVSNDGGTTWTNVETVGPDGSETSGGWRYHEFQLADFVAPTDQVKLRFIASDEGEGSLVEAALDDFRATAFSCEDVELPGDLNCDGLVNAFDIDPFILALTDPSAYEAAYPGCDVDLADINGDGTVNAFDIDPFVALLTGK